MTVRPILQWPDERLRASAADVPDVTDEIRAIWNDMTDTMEAMPGLGLAAVQIAVMRRLAVVDCSDTRGQVVRLANPRVVAASDDLFEWDEGSPCLPGVSARVARPRQVTVRFLDETGAERDQTFEDLWATSVQHQIDHLAGRMYFDRLSPVKRRMVLKKAEKARARA